MHGSDKVQVGYRFDEKPRIGGRTDTLGKFLSYSEQTTFLAIQSILFVDPVVPWATQYSPPR